MLTSITNEKRFLEIVLGLTNNTSHYYALHIPCSSLDMFTKTSASMKANALISYFNRYPWKGYIFICNDRDIIIIFHNENDFFVKECRQEIISRIFNDESIDGKPIDNAQFIHSYVLSLQWEDFFKFCRNKINRSDSGAFTSTVLTEIEETISNIDLTHVLRNQEICSVNDTKITPVFHEVYVSLTHLKKMLLKEVDLMSNQPLFRSFTLTLDLSVLQILQLRPAILPKNAPISLNLNIETLLTETFMEFDRFFKSRPKQTFIIEIEIGNIFTDMNKYIKARKHIQSLGYRVCIDGLSAHSFIQVERESLGGDFIKLQWNPDMAQSLSAEENTKFVETIKRCGSSRIILCRCDDKNAVDYGKSVGIQFFQGRYIDALLNPGAKIIN